MPDIIYHRLKWRRFAFALNPNDTTCLSAEDCWSGQDVKYAGCCLLPEAAFLW